MAGRNRAGLQFSGFREAVEQLERLDGDVKRATGKALAESQKIVAEASKKAMQTHNRTGQTARRIMEDGQVEWEGNRASIGIGFDIANGGLSSIFLMYGTPRQAPDREVYNAVYGRKVKDKIAEAQQKAFQDAIVERMGG